MIAIGIRYLNGWAMATHPAERRRPEWPPHPDRVFMALAAAYFETDRCADEREALVWLEGQVTPVVVASGYHERTIITSYVPVNDVAMPRIKPGATPSADQIRNGLALLPERRPRQPREFPVAIPEDPVVHFVWKDADPPLPVRSALSRLCGKVTYIGHSASLIQAWVEEGHDFSKQLVAEMHREILTPTSGGGARYRLRITVPGRLEDLEASYNEAAVEEHWRLLKELEVAAGKRKAELKRRLAECFGDEAPLVRRPAPGIWAGYEPERPVPQEASTKRTLFDDRLIVLRWVSGRPLGLESTLQVTAALRDTVLKLCPIQPPPEWISGHRPDGEHSQEDHLAFLPLPHVGREHADGHLLGIGVVVPRGIDPARQAECWRNVFYDDFGQAKPLELRLGGLGIWTLEIEDHPDCAMALSGTTWTAAPPAPPSVRWATVTPIALDRHSKGKGQWKEAEGIVARACERIGLPRPSDIILSPVAMFEGAPHVRAFPNIERKSDGGRIHHTHAVLTFAEPVIGPVLLGAGRYRGYGLLRPLRQGGGA